MVIHYLLPYLKIELYRLICHWPLWLFCYFIFSELHRDTEFTQLSDGESVQGDETEVSTASSLMECSTG